MVDHLSRTLHLNGSDCTCWTKWSPSVLALKHHHWLNLPAVFHRDQWLAHRSLLHTPTSKGYWTIHNQSPSLRRRHATTKAHGASLHSDHRPILEQCFAKIRDWCMSRQLLLNADRTKVIGFGSRTNLKKLSAMAITLQICFTIVQLVASLCNLCMYLESKLSLHSYVSKISSTFFHSCRFNQLRYIICTSMMQYHVSTFVAISNWLL